MRSGERELREWIHAIIRITTNFSGVLGTMAWVEQFISRALRRRDAHSSVLHKRGTVIKFLSLIHVLDLWWTVFAFGP